MAKNWEKDIYDTKYSQDTERDSSPTYGRASSFNSAFASPQKPRVTQVATSQKDYSKYVMGAKVKHIKFGVGTIITTKGVGEQMIADIAFNGVGIKSLSVKFAPMEII